MLLVRLGIFGKLAVILSSLGLSNNCLQGESEMREIEPEHTPYIYFTESDGVPGTGVISYQSGGRLQHLQMGGYVESLSVMEAYLRNCSDVRLVLIPSFVRPGTADVHYLFWDDGTDLKALDDKVELNTYTDADFENSIKTRYQRTWCGSCGSEWDTLVVDPADPYLGAPGLLQEKVGRQYAAGRPLNCPNCRASLRQFVVKIFR